MDVLIDQIRPQRAQHKIENQIQIKLDHNNEHALNSLLLAFHLNMRISLTTNWEKKQQQPSSLSADHFVTM